MGHCLTQSEEIDHILMDESCDPATDALRIEGVQRMKVAGGVQARQHASPDKANWRTVSLHLAE